MKRALAGTIGIVVVAGGAAVASGAVIGGAEAPPAKPLANAIHDALAAPKVQGITARISFTNKLIDSSSLVGGGPLLSGADGRLWLAADGRARLELQSDAGDAQITSNGKQVTVYDASSNTAYVAKLPEEKAGGHHDDADEGTTTPEVPSIDKIKEGLAKLAERVDLAGATGTTVAGQPAYSVKLSPQHDGGLIGSAELAWDAVTGVPLRAGIYAAGSTKPVLELAATDITYGAVDASALDVPTPAGAKIVNVDLGQEMQGDGATHGQKDAPQITGEAAVASAVDFKLAAPDELVGLPRKSVRLVGIGDRKGALVTYGANLGGIAVLQEPASAAPAATPAPKRHGRTQGLTLPKISIPGATGGEELATALGTVVRFERDGVSYSVIGSVPPAAAEAAARGL